MIVMWKENEAMLSEPENRLCKGASRLRLKWLVEEKRLKF